MSKLPFTLTAKIMQVIQYFVLLTFLPVSSQVLAQDLETESVKNVIQETYVQAVFVKRSEALVRSGFHPSFVMSVHAGDEIIQASLDMWLERLQLDDTPSGDDVRALFERVDVTQNTATVKLQVWINDVHTYTDYIGLYKFDDGWKIVNKIFAEHD